ncbi:MAG: hypothetical protein JOZ99_13870, partial [Actinobacteria bacterium]|nr:hypothetical protein [Actinomycetota bacterium]
MFWLLVGMTVVFPVGYLAWWASALTPQGAFTGIGPHYYLPMVVPLALLTASGIVFLWDRRRSWGAATAVALVVATVPFVPSKLTSKLDAIPDLRRVAHEVRNGVRSAGNRAALVMLPAQFVMGPFPFLGNDPLLANRVLYATDQGPSTPDLVGTESGRVAFRLIFEYAP